MKEIGLFNNLMNLYNNLTIVVDLKTHQIEVVYDGNNKLMENIPISVFTDYFFNIHNLNPNQESKLTKFIENLAPSYDPFNIIATYVHRDNETVNFEFKGVQFEEGRVLITIHDVQKTIIDRYDATTRVLTKENIIQKVKTAIQEQKEFALMILDLDNFKLFNDSYGHMFGDIVLVETAASIKKFLGNDGFVGRLGGDEFMILRFVENDYDQVHKACKTIRDAVGNVSAHNIKQTTITATVGCALYPQDAQDFETLFRKTDIALFRGKKKGRNCFIIYDKEKCRQVEEMGNLPRTTEQLYSNVANTNIVAGAFEILNRDGSVVKNINDMLTLIGNFFLLDRVAIETLNPEDDTLSRQFEWTNPLIDGIANLLHPTENDKQAWRENLDNTKMLKIVQIESNKDKLGNLYNILKKQKSSAILAFELEYKNTIYGLVRFEMCSTNRFWQQSNVASLMLISKLISIFLNKEYEKVLHKRELYYDRLTQVMYYSKWRDEIYKFINESDERVQYSLMNFTFENFHILNDLFGTKECDILLAKFGETLNEIFPDTCYTCRVNDDKFMAFIPTRDKAVIEKYFNDFIESYFTKTERSDIVKIYAGVYVHDGLDTLTSSIDKATITRKSVRGLKSKMEYFTEDLYEKTRRSNELKAHMHKALATGEFLLYLQPKVYTETGQVIGAEALTRWNYKGRRIIMPGEFIPLFEQIGFINELDFAVFENVCKFQKECIDKDINPLPISVNISRYQTNYDGYISRINEIRAMYNVPSRLIEIEITEGTYLANTEATSKFIENLHYYGYKVSMDDFGSGYSNLSSLAALDVDLMKLDRGFCTNRHNKKENVILSFVMTLAKSLNIDVLCEGVENEELVEYLKSVGCTIVQGFLYDRPIPASDFMKKYLLR
ncbi:MAG: EAL domain-containing protein [Acholeplasmatales bacterium]|nr:EAL domain-containing protein [Acholeplasmatales bacterium]